MQLEMQRDEYGLTYTEGYWTNIPGHHLPNIEQPWENNDPDHSCAPEALYELIPYFSPKHQRWTWCLHNPLMGIYAHKTMIPPSLVGKARSELEIHPANYDWQLLGCLAPGMTRGTAVNPNTGVVEPCVWSSAEAFNIIVSVLAPDGDIEHATGHTLNITCVPNTVGTAGYSFN